jgi:(1->4)-alpha-D-glucan 1-alpha-D-glucosylmutase
VLSEVPDQWAAQVRRWVAHNERQRRTVEGREACRLPDRNVEYLLYQVLVGAHPLPVERASAFVLKAAREAKTFTSWLAPDDEYEHALTTFVEAVLADATFLAELDAFVASIVDAGRVNSLSQLLWKLTAPGVPDIYQGTDLWDLSLVDPDNRRPVDYERRRALLESASGLDARAVMARADEGLPKLWLLKRALAVRSRVPTAFDAVSTYRAVSAEGEAAAHVVAFERGREVITVTQRLVARRGDTWGDTWIALPGGEWVDELTGREHRGASARVDDLLADFPVALLVRLGGAGPVGP